ncbi:geranylgeranyl reductase family [Legionella beliardensis]|uniref:Geranylgeranyl reductase family n=1 Tax=Legionella beliardensis TaxID=91822 RepID=A0A378I2H5_9GAMM|nr:FAD-dependent monooxygenase [Legionella beliardensis]STX29397.1 geranylgeranyl reductase family [Legionella beliardensis]
MPRIAILGGGFAGLCAAQRLSNKQNQIFIIDNYWLNANKRRGIPQANHLHILLLEGQRLLEKLFPGILNELLAAGAQLVDWSADTYWQGPYGKYPQYTSDFKTLLFSRQLLDKILYQRIINANSFVLIQGKVTRLIIDKKRIMAINYRNEQGCYQLEADLFIECRGRGSNLSQLLAEQSLPVKNKMVRNTLQYLSFKLPKDQVRLTNCKQFYLQADKVHNPLGFVISPIENNDYILTFISTIKDAFKNIKTLNDLLLLYQHPELNKLLDPNLKPVKFSLFHNLINQKKYFSRLKLANLLVLGDALCYLNPVYGQGMTVALKQVFTLNSHLKKPHFKQQKQIEQQHKIPWILATSEDLRWQTNKSVLIWCLNKLFSLWLSNATKNSWFHLWFLKILHMHFQTQSKILPLHLEKQNANPTSIP